MKRFVLFLTVLALGSAGQVQAGSITTTLGEQDFTNSFLLSFGEYSGSPDFKQDGEPAPFDNVKGSDGSSSFNESWIFSYSALSEPILSASVTIGIWEHDSANTGDQVASFTVDGKNLTDRLNAEFESFGGTSSTRPVPSPFGPGTVNLAISEYNIYTVTLPGTALASLADGSATFSLQLQNGLSSGFPGGPTATNGAGVDFSTLNITTQEAQPIIPEPSTFLLFGIGTLGIVGYGYRRRKQAA